MPNKQAISWRYDGREAQQLVEKVRDRGFDWSPAARRFHREMVIETNSMFDKLKLGGTYRGEYWPYFAPQYVRADGTEVPAWGGIEKVRGRGVVKGRKRPSGARIKQGDAVGQDTITMRRSALQTVRITRRRMVAGQNTRYAPYFSRLRRYAFFHLPHDLQMGRRILLQYIETGRVDIF